MPTGHLDPAAAALPAVSDQVDMAVQPRPRLSRFSFQCRFLHPPRMDAARSGTSRKIQSLSKRDPKSMRPRSQAHATMIQSPYDYDPKSIRLRSKVHTTTIQSPCDHDPKSVRPRSKVHTTTTQSPYEHAPNHILTGSISTTYGKSECVPAVSAGSRALEPAETAGTHSRPASTLNNADFVTSLQPEPLTDCQIGPEEIRHLKTQNQTSPHHGRQQHPPLQRKRSPKRHEDGFATAIA
jgi:hypothetical protein